MPTADPRLFENINIHSSRHHVWEDNDG